VSGAMLAGENARADEGQRQKQRDESRCMEHAGSLAGGRMLMPVLIE
jgi:hypothetical protein